ncbi:MAG: flagellar biosynthetic protein FliR [Pirellulales bacterium]|nr:flagellar biosynthetic protein FliR [Pirellulales bacterium]
MDWLVQLDTDRFLLFTLVFARISGLTMTAPIFGTREVPLQVRGLFAFALALLIMPTQWNVATIQPASMPNYVVLLAAELLIGLFLGLGIVFLLSGAQLAGGLIGRLGGLTLADVFDPASNEQVPLMGRLMCLFTLVIFVAIGGHRMVIRVLLDTFESLPPGCMALPVSIAHTLRELLTQSFVLGLRISAPVIMAVLLATLVLGLIGRTLPQLNLLAVGFGLNSMLSFGLLAMVLGIGAMVFQAQVEPTLELMTDALHAPFGSIGP